MAYCRGEKQLFEYQNTGHSWVVHSTLLGQTRTVQTSMENLTQIFKYLFNIYNHHETILYIQYTEITIATDV